MGAQRLHARSLEVRTSHCADSRGAGSRALRAFPTQAMDGKPVTNGALLPRAARTVRVVGDPGAAHDVSGGMEPRVEIDEAFVGESALLDVRLNEKLTPRLEQPRRFVEEPIADHPSLGVSLLPPRVWEMNEDAPDRSTGAKARKGLAGVLGKNPDPRCQAPRLEPGAHDGHPLAANLETDERSAGLDLRPLDEKPAATGPDLELDPITVRQRCDLDAARRQP